MKTSINLLSHSLRAHAGDDPFEETPWWSVRVPLLSMLGASVVFLVAVLSSTRVLDWTAQLIAALF